MSFSRLGAINNMIMPVAENLPTANGIETVFACLGIMDTESFAPAKARFMRLGRFVQIRFKQIQWWWDADPQQ